MKLHCVGKNKIQLHTYLINELDIKNTTINELAAEGAAIQDELYEERGINIMPGLYWKNISFVLTFFIILEYMFFYLNF